MPNCDIIIPVWNQLKDTKECVDSIRHSTAYPYRLIIIDNGSDKETAGYLENLEKEHAGNTTLIRNAKNEGFIKAVNKGISASNAEYVCILNNDTVVAPDWLREAIKVFDKDREIGIVNPSSNTLGQRLQDGVTLRETSKAIRNKSGMFVKLGSAFGFCMIVRRKVFDAIGLFDEIYGMGNFEDTDFSLRAKEKGYKTVRAFASYVYHKEKRSFNLLKAFKRDFEKNRNIFESKWGSPRRVSIVFREITAESTKRLKIILEKYAREKSWVYVMSPFFKTEEFFKNYSNLTFYHYKNFFYTHVFMKILFKKKKPDLIYSDSKTLSAILAMLRLFHRAEVKSTSEITG